MLDQTTDLKSILKDPSLFVEAAYLAGEWVEGDEGTFDVTNPARGDVIAKVADLSRAQISMAIDKAYEAQKEWASWTGKERAAVLRKWFDLMMENQDDLGTILTAEQGKPLGEARGEVTYGSSFVRWFAEEARRINGHIIPSPVPGKKILAMKEPVGVCAIITPWNFPIAMITRKVAPGLAAGCTMVVKPASATPYSALALAELAERAGIPAGVFNVITGSAGAISTAITDSPIVRKLSFTGSTEVGKRIREATAGSGKSLTLELGGKSPYIVFEDADIDSAIEGLVDAIWFNQGQVCCAGSRLLVQEGIAETFYRKLKARMDGLRIGNPLDKCIDVGAVVDPVQLNTITEMVENNTDGETYHAPIEMPAEGCFYPPTLITGLAPSSKLMQEEIFGPVLVSTTFRTPSEAVQLANNTRYGLAATLWTENVNLALDIAPKLVAGVVWINATNLFDAAAGFGGVRESGYGREGGWEGLAAYSKPKGAPKALKPVEAFTGDKGPTDPLDRTPKLYVGGKQARPDGGYSQNIYGKSGALLGQAPIANRKDIRNAVEAAQAAKGWSKTTGHLRAQILWHLVAVGLVEIIHVVAEGVRALVEDDRDMGGRIGAVIVGDVAEEHVAEARDRADGQPVGLAGKRRQGVVGAENEGRAVDQMQVVAFAECHGDAPLRLAFLVPRSGAHGQSPMRRTGGFVPWSGQSWGERRPGRLRPCLRNPRG